MSVRRMTLTLCVAVLAMVAVAHAAEARDYTIRLTSGNVLPVADAGEIAKLSATASPAKPVRGLVQLAELPDEIRRAELERAGITLFDPVPQNAYVASLSRPVTANEAQALGIRWATLLTAEQKQHRRVLEREFGEWARYEGGKVIVLVRLFPDVDREAGRTVIEGHGAVTGDWIDLLHTWVAALDADEIAAVAGEDIVLFVDALPPPLSAVNDMARQVVGANTVQGAPYNLDGSGIDVLVYDAGPADITHTDFAGRIVQGEAGSAISHATHVAGSVGGSGALSSGTYRGMAPGCDLISYYYETCSPYCLYDSPQDIAANYQAARNTYGADLATNSIGSNTAANGYPCSWEGDYESVSQLLDNIVRGSLGSPYIVLFAAGNERGYGTCGTTYNTMGVPAGAKNIITVGATDDADAMSSFSSWGPVDDGRIKPEVCAPGVNIYSTLPGNSYGNMSGTSMATPVTAGCVTLMLQQFALSYPGVDPLPSTIKALLMNTAVDLGNAGPDYQFGFGRINVQAAVDAVINGGFLEDQIALGETDTHTFTVLAGTPSLRVSLSWMDPAASPLANPTLINDLDLRLTSPTSTVYYPYILDPANPSNPATTGADHRNNSEQIVVANPAAGQWTITVSATSMPQSPQSYSLACSHSILTGYGRISGTVRDAASAPLEGVLCKNTGGPQQTYTTSAGQYQLTVAPGTYTLQYSKFGYVTATIPGIVVTANNTTTQDVVLQSAPTGVVSGTVTDCSGSPANGATVEVLNVPVAPTTTNSSGFYSITLPQGTYDMRASMIGCGSQTVTGVVIGATATQNFTLPSDPIYSCSAPDAGGYIACENGDQGGPTYNWIEISPNAGGPGTLTGITGDDSYQSFALPFGFVLYGTTYTTVYVSSNGFLTFTAGSSSYSNSALPSSSLGPAVVPFWDDLYPPGGGDISYYYYAAENAFIVEWRQIQHYPSGSPETFQVWLINDLGPNNSSRIRFQYQTVAMGSSCTIGVQSGTVANQYVFNGALDVNAQGLSNGRVIAYGGNGCVGEADISVSPTSVQGVAPLGGSDSELLQICNTGSCPLFWSISFNQITPALAVSLAAPGPVVEVSKAEVEGLEAVLRGDKNAEDPRHGARQLDASGGPDAFGYRWKDSNEPDGPVFSWVEISTIGTNVGITSDDQTVAVTLPWTFRYYGTDYTQVNVSSNGNLHFGTASTAYTNQPIPTAGAPDALIAPFWDDLYPPASGTVYRYDDVANNRFIIQWNQIARFSENSARLTFEAILYANGRIVFQYLTLSGTVNSSTVGIEDATGTVGLQVVYNADYLANNLAIEFGTTPEWLTFGSAASGSLDPGQCTNVTLLFEAGELPTGTYDGNLTIISNDPNENPTTVPVQFHVGQLAAPEEFTVFYDPATVSLVFRWLPVTGAASYRVYSAATPNGPFTTPVGSTSSTILTTPLTSTRSLFYAVVASDGALLESRPSAPGTTK